jgi:23S rRNA pseudouridine955/2504/2580 synthase
LQRERFNRLGKGAVTTEVDSGSIGQRIDNYLLRVLKGVPRAHVYQLIRSGQVRINRGRIRASYRLRSGDTIRIPPVRMRPARTTGADPGGLEWLERRVIFEDERLLVLDKPAGMAVHRGSGVSLGCIEALRCLRPKYADMDLVHRLDRGTSGCLLIAKKRSSLRVLHSLLRDGRIEKRYLALVRGQWPHGSITVDQPLRKERRGGSAVVVVDAAGKPATSRFALIDGFRSRASLVEVQIPTGRTHQIRVHAAALGYPIAGDAQYGDTAFNARMQDLGLRRMFLHAHAVSCAWPDTGVDVSVSAALPDDLKDFLDRLS